MKGNEKVIKAGDLMTEIRDDPYIDGRAFARVRDHIDDAPAVKSVPLSEVYRVIAGHSNYHGDNILAALTCIAEGKEVKPVRPLNPSVEVVQKWIPVTERLPDNICPVLVVLEGLRAVFLGWYQDEKWWSVGAGSRPFTQKVTHWMPLPEPPKGE